MSWRASYRSGAKSATDIHSKHVSIGKKMPGMEAWGLSSSSGVKVNSSLGSKLRSASSGAVKVVITDSLEMVSVHCSGSASNLDSLRSSVGPRECCYVVCFQGAGRVLLVTHIPELALAKQKMLYASSKSALKDALGSRSVEEFNASSHNEISSSEYNRRKNTAAPLTAAERMRIEHDNAETGGSYGTLAFLMGKGKGGHASVRLPGLAKGPNPFAGRKVAGSAPEIGERRKSIDEIRAKFERPNKNQTSACSAPGKARRPAPSPPPQENKTRRPAPAPPAKISLSNVNTPASESNNAASELRATIRKAGFDTPSRLRQLPKQAQDAVQKILAGSI